MECFDLQLKKKYVSNVYIWDLYIAERNENEIPHLEWQEPQQQSIFKFIIKFIFEV